MYYTIEQTLKKISRKQLLTTKKQYVAVLTGEEYARNKDLFSFSDDLDDELQEIVTCKAIVNHDSLTGSFAIPDRSNMDHQDHCFGFAMNKKGILFVDDSGYVREAIDYIIKTKKWNSPCLERFLYDFLDHIVKDDLRLMERFEQQLDEMEVRIENNDRDLSLHDSNYIRGSIRYLLIHYEQLIDMAQEFDENENGFFNARNLHYFHSFLSRLDRLYNNAAALRDYTIQLRDFHREQIAVKQNNIMTLLTVITSIFMPLTLITGWYGMNFRYMPELNKQSAYPIVFLVCIMIVIVSLIYFKKKKWL